MSNSAILDSELVGGSHKRRFTYGDQVSNLGDVQAVAPASPANAKQLYLENARFVRTVNVQTNWPRIVLRQLEPDVSDAAISPHSIVVSSNENVHNATLEESVPGGTFISYFWNKICQNVGMSPDPDWRATGEVHHSTTTLYIDPDEIAQFVSAHGRVPVVQFWEKLQSRISDQALQAVARTLEEVIPGSIDVTKAGHSKEAVKCRKDTFLLRAQKLDEHGQTDAALDLIYDQVDELMQRGEFDRLNSLLKTVNTDELSTDLLLGILTSTLPARNKLTERRSFFAAAKQSIDSRGENEDGLLTGLGD